MFSLAHTEFSVLVWRYDCDLGLEFSRETWLEKQIQMSSVYEWHRNSGLDGVTVENSPKEWKHLQSQKR